MRRFPQPRAVRTPIRGQAPCPISSRTPAIRSEEHTSELQSLMRISYAVFCLKKKKNKKIKNNKNNNKLDKLHVLRKIKYNGKTKKIMKNNIYNSNIKKSRTYNQSKNRISNIIY